MGKNFTASSEYNKDIEAELMQEMQDMSMLGKKYNVQ